MGAEVLSWLLLAAHVLIVLVAAVLISANRKPSAAIAWILAVIFIPVMGIIFFLLVGYGKLPRSAGGTSSARSVTPSWRGPTAWIWSVTATSGRTGWPRWSR